MILIVGSILAALVGFALICVLVFFTSRDRSIIFGSAQVFSYQGAARYYRLALPTEITDQTKLILALHGFGDNTRRFAYFSGVHNAAENDIVVYPQAIEPDRPGVLRGWNAEFCCGSGWVAETDDAGFLVALVQSLADEYGVSQERLFATGFSNGGFMTQRLAVDYPDVFRGIAVMAGSIGTVDRSLEPSQPLPILLMHGAKDQVVTFDGGPSRGDGDFAWRSFDETVQVWRDVNGDQAPVKTVVNPNDSHIWHDWRTINIWHRTPGGSRQIIDFFDAL